MSVREVILVAISVDREVLAKHAGDLFYTEKKIFICRGSIIYSSHSGPLSRVSSVYHMLPIQINTI